MRRRGCSCWTHPSHSLGYLREAVSSVVEKFRSAKTQSAALKQFMPRRTRDHSTPSSSLSREQSLPERSPVAVEPRPRILPRFKVQQALPLRLIRVVLDLWVGMRRAVSPVTGRGQTAEAFLPAPNALSSLKSVIATHRGLVCRSS